MRRLAAMVVLVSATAFGQHVPDSDGRVFSAAFSLALRACKANPAALPWVPIVKRGWVQAPCAAVWATAKDNPNVTDYFDDVESKRRAFLKQLDDLMGTVNKAIERSK